MESFTCFASPPQVVTGDCNTCLQVNLILHLHTLKLPRSLLFRVKSTSLCAKNKILSVLGPVAVLVAMPYLPDRVNQKLINRTEMAFCHSWL